MVGFNVCIIMDRVMANARNFTNMCFLCYTTKSKCFPSNHESEVCVKEEYSTTYCHVLVMRHVTCNFMPCFRIAIYFTRSYIYTIYNLIITAIGSITNTTPAGVTRYN